MSPSNHATSKKLLNSDIVTFTPSQLKKKGRGWMIEFCSIIGFGSRPAQENQDNGVD
jgi:hypothetical protein